MPTLGKIDLDHFDTTTLENECRDLWERAAVHRYDPDAPGEIFAVDTPPPYVSAAHLHVGHAMSYAQAEFVVRYQRMCGRKVFYPMGFDDNGLPTERYVETVHGVDKRRTTRAAFRALCLEETRRGAAAYEELWRSLGLSVDWSLGYSTIDPHCRATAQRSFLDLFARGRIFRSREPVLWDTHFETALAQADLETIGRRGQLHEVAFEGPEGRPLIIATTRPELLPACVALYRHPDDPRYAALAGATARVPLFGHEVPILADPDVQPDFGTGLMMVCTFGDLEDVRRWKRDQLPTRICLTTDGRLDDAAGPLAGLTVAAARKRALELLGEVGALRGQRTVEQTVSVAERSGVPVELALVPQWFVRVLDLKEELLARSAEIRWHPEWMKARLDHWIEGLQWDWNISRQRFYGVPFPLWLCERCEHPVLASPEQLPVDPLEDPPPVAACPRCGGALRGEPDVMDTWMTSSLTPLINANWAGTPGRRGGPEIYPMTVRVQAFEIIRTWLFTTVLKSHLHTGTLPWRDVMISGWGLNEQGKKIAKRDLQQQAGPDGFNRYDPAAVIARYGADALRHWAAGSQLGHDTRYAERDVKAGRKVVVKLWNAARFTCLQLEGFDPAAGVLPLEDREPEDRWLLGELDAVIPTAHAGFARYDYAVARQAIDRFFWGTFCDDYLEMVKDRFWNPERTTEAARASARITLWEALRTLLGLYAPFLPFVTEALYQRIYAPVEGARSLHLTRYPDPRPEPAAAVPEMEVVTAVLRASRALRTSRRIPQTRSLLTLTVDPERATPAERGTVERMERTLRAVTRAGALVIGRAPHPVDGTGLRLDLVEAPKEARGAEVEGSA